MIEPEPLDQLLPGWRAEPPPICVPVSEDRFYFFTRKRAIRLPTPPQQRNHGNFIVSLGATCAWLAAKAEALGVEIYPGFAAAEALFDEKGAVRGVRIGDLGLDREGKPKPSYTPGVEIEAEVTVLAEGARGHLAKQLIRRYGLDAESQPQSYSIGMKELWQLPLGECGQVS